MTTQYLTPNEKHKKNSADAIHGVKAPPGRYQTKLVKAALSQNGEGRWLVSINGGLAMPATDVEVSLWVALQDALRREA